MTDVVQDLKGISERLNSQAYFVTGTDTDVGKTIVSCSLVRAWGALGQPVCAVKPFASGCTPRPGGGWGGGDGPVLHAAAGADADDLLRECGCVPGEALQSFREALGPVSAARAEGRVPDVEDVSARLALIRKACARDGFRLLVEGVGGPLVPLGAARGKDSLLVADWLADLRMPAVLATRTRLGTISTTLMAVEVLRGREIEIAAVIASRQQPGPLQPDEVASLTELRENLPGVEVVVLDYLETS